MPAAGETYNPWHVFVGSFIPNGVLRCPELTSTAKLVFGRLCQYAGENGQSYPTYQSLAYEVGVVRRQAIRAVKELEAFGLIRPVGRHRSDGGSTSNVYVFLWHNILHGFAPDEGGLGHGPGGECHGSHPPRVTKCHSGGCHGSHRGVTSMSPHEENHTRESVSEKTTTTSVRSSLSGTPLSKIPDGELVAMGKRYGSDRLLLAADVAAETWRRGREEIRNPAGYLQSLLSSLVIPEWYVSLDKRRAAAEAAKGRRALQDAETIAREREEKALEAERHALWESLSEEEREKFRAAAVSGLPEGLRPAMAVNARARKLAWEARKPGLRSEKECAMENPSKEVDAVTGKAVDNSKNALLNIPES